VVISGGAGREPVTVCACSQCIRAARCCVIGLPVKCSTHALGVCGSSSRCGIYALPCAQSLQTDHASVYQKVQCYVQNYSAGVYRVAARTAVGDGQLCIPHIRGAAAAGRAVPRRLTNGALSLRRALRTLSHTHRM
jgi:hypothetical protein